MTRKTGLWIVLGTWGFLAIFAANAGRMLVVDSPQPSDVIVVLAGETDRRPAYAIELLNRGYARRILLDVPAAAKVFGVSEVQIAEQYVQSRSQAASIDVCPITGLSTKAESHDVEECLAHVHSNRVLIVTSDFHTRRSLSIFRHEVCGKDFSVAAVRDDTQFGTRWWTHRQWAKTCVDEWMRWIWWNVIERWH